jgi:Family of unknown function (DUF6524)
MNNEFNGQSFLVRLGFAVLLVFGTYNPTDFCYTSWLWSTDFAITPVKALVGVTLLIGWIIYLRATLLSLGGLGITLFLAFFSCLIWVLVDAGLLSLDASGAMTWIVLLIISLILATGMSWSHIRRRMSGQVSVDDVED